jgi:hypothetical protein
LLIYFDLPYLTARSGLGLVAKAKDLVNADPKLLELVEKLTGEAVQSKPVIDAPLPVLQASSAEIDDKKVLQLANLFNGKTFSTALAVIKLKNCSAPVIRAALKSLEITDQLKERVQQVMPKVDEEQRNILKEILTPEPAEQLSDRPVAA